MNPTPSTRLAAATAVVTDAATLARSFFSDRDLLSTETKSGPQDFVTIADRAVEQRVRDRLAAAFSGETVVGEELGGTGGDAYWIVDPIDGTANFLSGSPLWGVSLGYVVAGKPVLGVVAIPMLGEVLAADGASLFLNGQPFKRSSYADGIDIVSLGDSVDDDIDDVTALHLGLRRGGWVVECFHSTSVSMAFAAMGRLAGHLQKRTTMWDIAGGAALCAAAGLEVEIGHTVPGEALYVKACSMRLRTVVDRLW